MKRDAGHTCWNDDVPKLAKEKMKSTLPFCWQNYTVEASV